MRAVGLLSSRLPIPDERRLQALKLLSRIAQFGGAVRPGGAECAAGSWVREPALQRLGQGREIARLGIDALWGVRGLAKEIVAGAEAEGITSTRFFESAQEAAVAVLAEAREGDLILVKGSRSVETEKVIAVLRERFPLVGEKGI